MPDVPAPRPVPPTPSAQDREAARKIVSGHDPEKCARGEYDFRLATFDKVQQVHVPCYRCEIIGRTIQALAAARAEGWEDGCATGSDEVLTYLLHVTERLWAEIKANDAIGAAALSELLPEPRAAAERVRQIIADAIRGRKAGA